MREVIYYECEICGERFTDEEECERHETAHQAEGIDPNNVYLWDKGGNRIPFEDFMADQMECCDNLWAVETTDDRARSYIHDTYKGYFGYGAPYDHWGGLADEDGLIYYDEDKEKWVSYQQEMEQLLGIREKFSVDA